MEEYALTEKDLQAMEQRLRIIKLLEEV